MWKSGGRHSKASREAEQLGSVGKHEVVESEDGMAKQVWSWWKRAANGKGKGKLRGIGIQAGEGEHVANRSEFMAEHMRQMKIMTNVEN